MIPRGVSLKAIPEHLLDFFFGDLSGSERIDHQRDRLGDSDRVGQLNLGALCDSRGHDILGQIPGHVRGASIHLGRVFAGKSAAAVMAVTAVGIDDDLASRQAAVSLGTSDSKPSGRVYVVTGILGSQMLRYDRFDDVFHHLCANLLNGNRGIVLRGNHNRIDLDGFETFVQNRYL